jgi:uncharacterized protein YceK
MRKTISLVIAAILVLGSGCASIVSKSDWPVRVSSNPAGATCTVLDKKGTAISKAVTPTIFMLKSGDGFFRSADYTLRFEKEGYQPASTELSAGLNGWYWGNIVFGGLIGMLIVDPATGAMWRLDESVTGTMAELPAAASPASISGGPAAEAMVTAAPANEVPSSPTQSPAGPQDTSGIKDAAPSQGTGTL